jgi:hypothetical protein
MINEKLDQHQLRRVSDAFRWGHHDAMHDRPEKAPDDDRADDYVEGHQAGRIDRAFELRRKNKKAVMEAVVAARKGSTKGGNHA